MRPPTSVSICRNGAVSAARRRLMTIQRCGSICASLLRSASRTRRFIRLRTTALPSARGAVKPILGPDVSGERQQKAAKHPMATFTPSSYTFRNSALRSSRFAFGYERRRGGVSGRICLLCPANCALVTDRQLFAAGGAAARQNRATVLCFHTLAEAVNLGSLAVIGLERPFGHV